MARRLGCAFPIRVMAAQLLGTAGAIRKALPLLGTQFFVLYGDSYLPCDYSAVRDAFEAVTNARSDDDL